MSKMISNAKRGREASDYADYTEFGREEAEGRHDWYMYRVSS
ncbi:MAG: hypothetical protein V1736_10200 [Pseudomonadota bacterium]